MSIEDTVKRQQAAIQKVERMSGPAMMKVVRDTQDRQSRGEEVSPSALKMVELFKSQVETEVQRSSARDLWASIPRLVIIVLAFVLAVYVSVRLLRAVGAL